MKKGFLRVCLLTALFLMAGTITAFADNSTYITGSKINGFQVGGMTPEEAGKVLDPFFTTRTTRKVGLGVPFFKQAAESAGGSFQIGSEEGKGTEVTAVFRLRKAMPCLSNFPYSD